MSYNILIPFFKEVAIIAKIYICIIYKSMNTAFED